VLVLGGTGFIGSEVTLACREAGWAVRAVARRPLLSPLAAAAGVELVLGPAEDPILLARALEGVDWVVHAVGCAPPGALTDDFDSTTVSVLGLDTLLEALRCRPGVGLTFVSSGGAVYGDVTHLPVDEETRCRPISAYGLSKLMAEDSITAYSARYGIPARILRVSNAYGPGQDAANGHGVIGALLQAALTDAPVPVYDGGRAVRDFVHVGDVANAIVTIRPGQSEPQVVNVGGGAGHSVLQILETVEQLTGAPLRIEWRPRRPSDVHSIVLNVSRLAGLMAWEPRDLETGIAQIWHELGTGVPSTLDPLPA
jgi:UDP-glucose 4-epimerase